MLLPGWLGRIGDDLRDAQVREWGWNGAFSLATRQFNELICLALWMTIQYDYMSHVIRLVVGVR